MINRSVHSAFTQDMSTSSVLAFPGPLLSVHRPVAASASFWVYGSSFSCLTLQTGR